MSEMQVVIRCPDISVQRPLTEGQIQINLPDYQELMKVGDFRQVVVNTMMLVMPDPRVYMSATVDDVEIVGANLNDTLKNSFRHLRSGLIVDVNILPSAYQRLQRAQQSWANL